MSRGLSASMQSLLTAEVIRPILLIDLMFDTAPLYLWNGVGNLSYDSKTYIGAGTLLSVGGITESTELQANGTSIVLSGIGSALTQVARDEDYQGRLAYIKLGAMDENADVIATPIELFSGFMDVMTITESGETSSIALTIENRLIAFDRTNVRRYTDQDQKIDYASDYGLEHVTAIQEMEVRWGRPGYSGVGANTTGGRRNEGKMVNF